MMNKETGIKYARSFEEIEQCWEVMKELRAHLNKENFVNQVLEMMQEKYQIITIKHGHKVIAFAGFRAMHFLNSGNIIYIDDLCTLQDYRGKGHASELLDYIIEIGKQNKVNEIQLDSGYKRFDAHRLYLNKKFKIVAHHFSLDLN
jgi:GNAT superfamily N-acetyltransferase